MNSRPKHQLDRESYWNRIYLILFVASALSGVAVGLPIAFSSAYQLNLLGHSVLSLLLFLPLLIYCYVHFRRTIGVRNPLLIFSGLLLILVLLGLFGSGFWFAFAGQSERFSWVTALHAVSAYAVLGLVAAHLIAHAVQRSKKRKDAASRLFITFDSRFVPSLAVFVSAYILLLTMAGLIVAKTPENSAASSAASDYAYVYGDHPFRPSQTETSTGGFVEVEQIARSADCGTCHADIFDQWHSSVHRQSASDPAYVKNINLLESTRGISATRYCEGCHAPVALLTGELTPGGKHGGVVGTPAHGEGVGCMGCHGIDQVVHLNGTASYLFDPKERYLFETSHTAAGRFIRNYLIRLQPGQHKRAMGPDLMQDPQLCASCHEQFMDASMNDWGWVKMQSEYTNWLSSPFSGQSALATPSDSALTCQNCHFPLVAGEDPSADVNGHLHSHRSLGANTVLPLLNGDAGQLEAVKRFLEGSKLLVNIDRPSREDAIQNVEFVNEELRPGDRDNTPFFMYLNESARIKVSVTNHSVGHTFPGGTTDINQAWLHFKIVDADDYVIFESGALDEDLNLDETAHIYHSIPVDRQGKRVWKHDLFRMTGNAYKNVIDAGGVDIKEYEFRVPAWAKNPITVTATLRYRKFNQRYARWALNHPRPVLPVVDMARDTLSVPIKLKPIIQDKESRLDD